MGGQQRQQKKTGERRVEGPWCSEPSVHWCESVAVYSPETSMSSIAEVVTRDSVLSRLEGWIRRTARECRVKDRPTSKQRYKPIRLCVSRVAQTDKDRAIRTKLHYASELFTHIQTLSLVDCLA